MEFFFSFIGRDVMPNHLHMKVKFVWKTEFNSVAILGVNAEGYYDLLLDVCLRGSMCPRTCEIRLLEEQELSKREPNNSSFR